MPSRGWRSVCVLDSAESRGALLLLLEPHQAVIEEVLYLLVVPARPLLISRFELHAVVIRVWLTVIEPACQDQRRDALGEGHARLVPRVHARDVAARHVGRAVVPAGPAERAPASGHFSRPPTPARRPRPASPTALVGVPGKLDESPVALRQLHISGGRLVDKQVDRCFDLGPPDRFGEATVSETIK